MSMCVLSRQEQALKVRPLPESKKSCSSPFNFRALMLLSHDRDKTGKGLLEFLMVKLSSLTCFIQTVCLISPSFKRNSCCKRTQCTKLSLCRKMVFNYSSGQNCDKTVFHS